jgi:hypothetical protein
MERVYQGTVGLKISIVPNIEVKKVVFSKLIVRLPNKELTEWFSTVDVDNNEIYYITDINDLKLAGKYIIQPYIETDDGYKGYGDKFILSVSPTINKEEK